MTRDYAKKRHTKQSQKKSTYILLWLITLVFFGLFTYGLVYLGNHQHHARLHNKKANLNRCLTGEKSEKTIEKNKTTDNIKTIPSTKFEFYTILPQKNKNSSIPEYILEIATVSDYASADHLKAEISLLGLEANVDSVINNGKQFYNIEVGPYDNKDAAMADLERLKESNIKSALKKIK